MTYNVNNIRKPDIVPHLFWNGDWDALNADEKEAWKVVGYTMTTWNNNTLTLKSFEDYTDNQKKAINDLGYQDYMWDDYPINISYPYTLEEWNDDGSDATVTNIDDYYEEHDWADLTKYQQELFETLGDKECNWEEEGGCDDINIPWKDLTIAQKAAATYLGFSEADWAIWVGTTGDNGNTDGHTDGHADNTDGHADNTDGHADNTDGHADNTDGHADNTDGHADNTDGHADNTDGHADNTDGHADNTDGHADNTDGHADNTDGHADNTDGHADKKEDVHGDEHDHNKHTIILGPVSGKLIFILTLLKIPLTTEPKENKVVIEDDKEILDLLKKFI